MLQTSTRKAETTTHTFLVGIERRGNVGRWEEGGKQGRAPQVHCHRAARSNGPTAAASPNGPKLTRPSRSPLHRTRHHHLRRQIRGETLPAPTYTTRGSHVGQWDPSHASPNMRSRVSRGAHGLSGWKANLDRSSGKQSKSYCMSARRLPRPERRTGNKRPSWDPMCLSQNGYGSRACCAQKKDGHIIRQVARSNAGLLPKHAQLARTSAYLGRHRKHTKNIAKKHRAINRSLIQRDHEQYDGQAVKPLGLHAQRNRHPTQ